jgi:hypothetical protein
MTRAGARGEFENLVDVVHRKHPQVRGIAANPGDWGIDGFVGQRMVATPSSVAERMPIAVAVEPCGKALLRNYVRGLRRLFRRGARLVLARWLVLRRRTAFVQFLLKPLESVLLDRRGGIDQLE